MEKIIRELKDAGVTVVLATHLIEQGLALCEERLHLCLEIRERVRLCRSGKRERETEDHGNSEEHHRNILCC